MRSLYSILIYSIFTVNWSLGSLIPQSQAPSSNQEDKKGLFGLSVNPQFYFTGDSLIEYGQHLNSTGWLLQLQDKYIRKGEVLARGYAGYNAKWYRETTFQGLVELELIPRKEKVKVVTFLLGSNDAVDKGSPMHYDIDAYKKTMKEMVKTVQFVAPNALVVLITPPPLNEAMWEVSRLALDPNYKLDRRNDSVKNYAEVVRNLCKELNCTVLDLWKVFKAGDTEVFYDGVHFNAKGSTLFAEAWLNKLKEVRPELAPEKLPFVKKPWRELAN